MVGPYVVCTFDMCARIIPGNQRWGSPSWVLFGALDTRHFSYSCCEITVHFVSRWYIKMEKLQYPAHFNTSLTAVSHTVISESVHKYVCTPVCGFVNSIYLWIVCVFADVHKYTCVCVCVCVMRQMGNSSCAGSGALCNMQPWLQTWLPAIC